MNPFPRLAAALRTPDPIRESIPWTWLLVAVFLAVFMASAIILSTQILASVPRILLFSAAALLTAPLPLVVDAMRDPRFLFSAKLFGLAGILVFLVVAMLKTALIYGTTVSMTAPTAVKAVLVVASALGGFLLGNALPTRMPRPGRLSRSCILNNRLLVFTLVLGLTGLVATILFFSPFGDSDRTISKYYRLVSWPLAPAGALAVWLLFTMRPRTPARRLLLYAVLLPLPVAAAVTFSRVPLTYIVGFVYAVYVYRLWVRQPGRLPFGRIVAVGSGVAVVLLLFVAVVGVLRYQQFNLEEISGPYGSGPTSQNILRELTELTTLDTFDTLVQTIQLYPERDRYLYGWSVAGVIVSPIPRSLWAEKPYGFGRLLVEELGLARLRGHSLAPSFPGELIANFGYLAPFIAYLLMGIVAARLHEGFLRARAYSPYHVLYLGSLMWFLLESRGDLHSINLRMGWYFFCMYVVLRLSSRTVAEAPGRVEALGRNTPGSPRTR